MELRHLRHFLVLAEEQHFARAAARLGMQQAPLSQSIRRLEEALGARLFDRSPQTGTRLTPAGRRMLPRARDALRAVEAACDAARDDASAAPAPLRVGFVTLGLLGPLPAAMRALDENRPGIAVRLEEGTTASLLEAVAEGRLDMALTHPTGRRLPGLAHLPLRRDRIVAALPAAHPLARRGRVALRDLAAEPLIFFPEGAGPELHLRIRDAFRLAGLDPRIEQEARSTPTMLLLVAAGLGYALVAESARALPFSNVAFAAVPELEALDWGLVLAWRPEAAGPAARRFVARLTGTAPV